MRVAHGLQGWDGGSVGRRVAHGLLRVGERVCGWEGGTRVTKGGMAGPWVGGWYSGY